MYPSSCTCHYWVPTTSSRSIHLDDPDPLVIRCCLLNIQSYSIYLCHLYLQTLFFFKNITINHGELIDVENEQQNSKGLITLARGSPLRASFCVDNVPLTFTCIVREVKKFLVHLCSFSLLHIVFLSSFRMTPINLHGTDVNKLRGISCLISCRLELCSTFPVVIVREAVAHVDSNLVWCWLFLRNL